MALKPAHSLRLIGVEDGHREILRVDRSGRTAPCALFRKTSCDRSAMRPISGIRSVWPPDGIYVSHVGLNAENGVVETPHVPTLLIAKPVMAPDGKPFGIVIINADMRPALDRVRSSVRKGEDAYVVDGRGEYLVHPDRAREFGSQLGKPNDWRSDLPALASLGWCTAKCRADRAGKRRAPGRHSAGSRAPGRQRMGRRRRAGSQRRLHGVRRGDPELIAAGWSDRRAVRGRTGRVHCENADPADHPIDGGRRGRRPRRRWLPFRSMRAARPACSRAHSPG